ncbi:MAG: ArsR family transcriptional regulator [Thermosphaera sp.]
MTLDEKIEVVIELLTRVLVKLEKLESEFNEVGLDPGMYRIALEIATSFSKPLVDTLEIARRAYSVIASLTEIDSISRAIVYTLSTCDSYSISELTKKVREIRGTSSRRIISDRVKGLIARGIVVNIGSNQRPKVMLKSCSEEGRSRKPD